MSCERVKAAFEPGSGQYNIRREFDQAAKSDHSIKKFGPQALQYQENLKKVRFNMLL